VLWLLLIPALGFLYWKLPADKAVESDRPLGASSASRCCPPLSSCGS
jgi:hypothetical protein